MERCKYSQSSIDIYHRSLVDSNIELEEKSKTLPNACGDSCGYGYQTDRRLPTSFPYTLESTLGDPMVAKRCREKLLKRNLLKRSGRSVLERTRVRREAFMNWCTRCSIGFGAVLQRLILFGFWSWVCLSLIDLFKAAEETTIKRHAVVPKSIRMPDMAYFVLPPEPIIQEELTVNVKLHGPFIPKLQQNREYNEEMMNGDHKQYVFHCALERWLFIPPLSNPNLYKLKKEDAKHTDAQPTAMAKIMMTNDSGTTHVQPFDYNNYPRTARLALLKTIFEEPIGPHNASIFYALGFGINEENNYSVPFSMEFRTDPISMRTRVLIGMIPLLVLCALIILRINRAVAAYIAMATALAGYVKVGEEIEIPEVGQWLDGDVVVYVFASMMLVSVISETKLYSSLSYTFVRLTYRDVGMALVFLNVIAGFLSVFFNNMFVGLLIAPMVIRMMELLDRNPIPVLINLMTICNICGKAYVGTFIVRIIVNHTEAINAGIHMKKILSICMMPSLIVAGVTGVVWFCIYSFLKPHEFRHRIAIADLKLQLALWKRLSKEIPDVSVDYHVIRMKIDEKKDVLKQELDKLMQLKELPYKEMKSEANFKELYYDTRIYNWYLVVKVFIAFVAFIGLIAIYFYNVHISWFHDYGETRLGYLAFYAVLLLFLMLHSRDFEILLKRVDWQALVLFVAFGIIAAVFVRVTGHMDDFLWKLYGMNYKNRRRKIHQVLVQMLSYTSVAGICNEHVVSVFFLDTILEFSIFRGLNAIGELLGGYIMACGFWGNATILGTGANILIAGFQDSQGYTCKFLHHMWYGVPIAFVNIVTLYIYIGFTYLM